MGKKSKVFLTGVVAAAAATAVVANKQKKQKAEGKEITGFDVDEKFSQFKDKVEELQILAANATAQPRENLKVSIQNVKGDAISQAEVLRRKAERSKSKLSSELLRAQMNLEVKKEELEKEFEKKKYENQKAKDEAKAIRKAEDAAIIMDFALEMVEQATVTSLEATELAEDYKEKYGEEISFDTEEEETEEIESAEEAKEDGEETDEETTGEESEE